MREYKIGDRVLARPFAHWNYGRDKTKPLTDGRAVYVNVPHRWLTVEMKIGYGIIRECYKPEDVKPCKEEWNIRAK